MFARSLSSTTGTRLQRVLFSTASIPTTFGTNVWHYPIQGAEQHLPLSRDTTKFDSDWVARNFLEAHQKNVPSFDVASHVTRFLGFHSKCSDPELWGHLAKLFAASLESELRTFEGEGMKDSGPPPSSLSFQGVYGHGEKVGADTDPIIPDYSKPPPKRPIFQGYKVHLKRYYGIHRSKPFNMDLAMDPRMRPRQQTVKVDEASFPDTPAHNLRRRTLQFGQEVALSVECFRVKAVMEPALWQAVVRLTRMLISVRLLDFSSGSRIYLALASAEQGDRDFWELLARALRGNWPMEVTRRNSDVQRVLAAMRLRNPFSDLHNRELWEELLYIAKHPMPHVPARPREYLGWTVDAKTLAEGLPEEIRELVRPEVLAYWESHLQRKAMNEPPMQMSWVPPRP
eukprot:RCo022386